MKTCPNCGAQMQDDSMFCSECGAHFAQQSPPGTYQYVPPYDHTAEFDAQDISKNKVLAMLCYLMGTTGIIIALLGSNHSPYAGFHVRQSLKFTVINILLLLVGLILCWTFIVPIACVVFYCVLLVVKIICFFSVCVGKAKEPAIIRSFGFLK